MKQKTKKMERPEEKLIFWRVFLIISLLFLANIVVYISNYGKENEVTGLSVGTTEPTGGGILSTISELYNSIPVTTKIFIGIQWGLLLIILIFTYVKDKKTKVTKEEIKGIDLEKASENAKTDLDTLYTLLKEKKQLRISTLTRLFNVGEEIMVGWCKTLESSNLVTIDYPTRGEVVVRIVEESSKEKD